MNNKNKKSTRKIRMSKALEGRLLSSVRQGRRETIFKIIGKKNNGIVPCYVCGEHVKKEQATLEHIIPLSLDGTDDMDNLWISHEKCNRRRGNNLKYPCFGVPPELRISSDRKNHHEDLLEELH